MAQELDSCRNILQNNSNDAMSNDGCSGYSAISNESQNSEYFVQFDSTLTSESDQQVEPGEANTSPPPLGLLLDLPSTLVFATNVASTSLASLKTREANSHSTILSISDQQEKLRATNFPASLLQISSWRISAKNEGDLVVKLYYSKRKLVWEILEHCLKKKIEIHWNHIVGMKAIIEHNKPAILEIELIHPPMFFKETSPQPKRHTIWHPSQDFTNEQASLYRIHHLEIPYGAMDKHFDKLLKCEPRFMQLIQGPFPILSSRYFPSNFDQRIGSSMPTEFKVQPSSHFGIQGNKQGTGCEMTSDFIDPIKMYFGSQAIEQVNGCEMLPEYKPMTNIHYSIQEIGQENGCNIAPEHGMCFGIPDNGQLSGNEMAAEFGPTANVHFGMHGNNGCQMVSELKPQINIHYGIHGNRQNMAVGFDRPMNMHFGIEESRKENFCNMIPDLKAHTNTHSWHGNGSGMEMATSFVAPANIPFSIHGNRHGVDSFQPAPYSRIPSIAPVPHSQIHEQISRPSYWTDSSKTSYEGISNPIVNNTSMAYWNQGMENFQNHHQIYNPMGQLMFSTVTTTQEDHHQDYNSPITSDEGLQNKDGLTVTDIGQHLLGDSEAQYTYTQNLQAKVDSMHSFIDLHNEMNRAGTNSAVSPVENTTLPETQMIPKENWVSNTVYSNGARPSQQFQPQPLNWVASHQAFTGNSGIQQTHNSSDPPFPQNTRNRSSQWQAKSV